MNLSNFRSIPLSKVIIACAAAITTLVIVASLHKHPERPDNFYPTHAIPNPATSTILDGTVIDIGGMWHTEELEEEPK